MNLTDRVAIVTGSGRGIGRAIALKLAELGATVVVSDILAKEAEAVAGEIKAAGGKSLAVIADVSLAADVTRLVEATIKACGRIDILVNNAGIARDQLLVRMPEEDWDKVLAVDLKSVFLCTKAVLRPMLKAAPGPDYQSFQHHRHHGQQGAGQLRFGQGRRYRLYPLYCQGGRLPRRHRQRHCPRLY
jgi:3-oxoacyl-[acyl-carrier protein] reductase